MKSFKQTVADALSEVRAEAVQCGVAMGFAPASASVGRMFRAANDELTRYELANPACDYPTGGKERAALALSNVLDPAFINEADSINGIDRELAVLRRLAAKQAGQRVAA